MSEVQYTVRDAINRLKVVNALGKTNLSNKGVDLPGEENTTYEVVDGIHGINGLALKVGQCGLELAPVELIQSNSIQFGLQLKADAALSNN